MTTGKHPSPRGSDDIEQAIRLLVRAGAKLRPHGLLICKLEWHPAKKPIRKKARNKS